MPSLVCQHLHVFTSLEALWAHHSWIFMEASPHRHDRLLTQSPAPLPFLEDRGGSELSRLLAFLVTHPYSYTIQEPIHSLLIKIKGTPITWKIPRGIGALSENRAEAKYFLLCHKYFIYDSCVKKES